MTAFSSSDKFIRGGIKSAWQRRREAKTEPKGRGESPKLNSSAPHQPRGEGHHAPGSPPLCCGHSPAPPVRITSNTARGSELNQSTHDRFRQHPNSLLQEGRQAVLSPPESDGSELVTRH